jgi:hypothetical protein
VDVAGAGTIKDNFNGSITLTPDPLVWSHSKSSNSFSLYSNGNVSP